MLAKLHLLLSPADNLDHLPFPEDIYTGTLDIRAFTDRGLGLGICKEVLILPQLALGSLGFLQSAEHRASETGDFGILAVFQVQDMSLPKMRFRLYREEVCTSHDREIFGPVHKEISHFIVAAGKRKQNQKKKEYIYAMHLSQNFHNYPT